MAELGREDWTEDTEPEREPESMAAMPREFVPDRPFGRGAAGDTRRPAWDTPPPPDGAIDFPIPPSMRNRLGQRPVWDTPPPENGELDFPIPPSMRNRLDELSTRETATSTGGAASFAWPPPKRADTERPAWDTLPPADGESDFPIPPSMRDRLGKGASWQTSSPASGQTDVPWPPAMPRPEGGRPAWDTPPPPDGAIDFPIPPSMRGRLGAQTPLPEQDEDEAEDAAWKRPASPWLRHEPADEATGDQTGFPWPPSLPRPVADEREGFTWPPVEHDQAERDAAAHEQPPELPRRSAAAEEMLSRFSIPARGEELVSKPIAPLPGHDHPQPEIALPEQHLSDTVTRVRAGGSVSTDLLLDAINRTKNGSAPLPVTLITGVPPYPGILGPLMTHVAGRLRARRPWGWWDRLAAGHTMLANMLEAIERKDLDGAVRYLFALLLDDALATEERALLIPLWNVNPEDYRGYSAFRALSGLITLAITQRRVVLHLIATSRAGQSRAAEKDFDLVVPVEQLAVGGYDEATRAALQAVATGKEPPRERDLRLHLPIVQLQRRHDELTLGVRAPEIERPKGLGGLLRGVSKQKEEEQYAAFARQAMATAFRWDPFLQYVHLTLLREERGVRRAVLEIAGSRTDYPEADTEAA